MKVVPFVLGADAPGAAPRLGALLPEGVIVDLQAAHVAMTERVSPFFRDEDAFRAATAQAAAEAARVVEWVRTQRPPGTSVPADKARSIGDPLYP